MSISRGVPKGAMRTEANTTDNSPSPWLTVRVEELRNPETTFIGQVRRAVSMFRNPVPLRDSLKIRVSPDRVGVGPRRFAQLPPVHHEEESTSDGH